MYTASECVCLFVCMSVVQCLTFSPCVGFVRQLPSRIVMHCIGVCACVLMFVEKMILASCVVY